MSRNIAKGAESCGIRCNKKRALCAAVFALSTTRARKRHHFIWGGLNLWLRAIRSPIAVAAGHVNSAAPGGSLGQCAAGGRAGRVTVQGWPGTVQCGDGPGRAGTGRGAVQLDRLVWWSRRRVSTSRHLPTSASAFLRHLVICNARTTHTTRLPGGREGRTEGFGWVGGGGGDFCGGCRMV